MTEAARHKQKGRAYEQREQWKRAIAEYEAAVEQAKKSGDEVDLALYNRIGDLYRRTGDVNRAVSYYEAAADAHMAAGFYNNAIALCNKILRSMPKRHSVHLKLGKIGAAKGFLQDARKHFLEYAEHMQRAGQLDKAFAALMEFADLSPDPEVRLMIADQLLEHEHEAQAIQQLRLAWRDMVRDGRESDARAVRDRIVARAPEEDPEVHPPEPEAAPAGLDAEGVVDLPELEPYPYAEDASAAAVDVEAVDIVPTALAETEPAETDEAASEVEELEIVPTSLTDDDESEVAAAEAVTEVDDGSEELDIDQEEVEGLELIDENVEGLELVDEGLEELDLIETDPDVGAPSEEETSSREEADVPVDGEGGVAVDLAEAEADVIEAGAVEADALEADAREAQAVEPAEEEPSESRPPPGPEPVEMPAASATPEVAMTEPDVAPEWRVEELRARLQAEGPDPELQVSLSDALLEIGERAEATQYLREALERFEDRGELREVQSVIDELLYLNRNDVRAYQKRVELALKTGERGTLIEAYLDLADCLDRTDAGNKARIVYTRVLELDPDNRRALAALEMLGDETATGVDETKEAPSQEFVDLKALVTEEMEKQPKSTRFTVPAQEPESEEEVNFQGMLDQFKSKVAEAIEEEDASSHYDLGIAFKEMGLIDEAITEFQIASRSEDHRLRAVEMLGACFLEKEENRIALKVLNRVLQSARYPDDEMVGIFYGMGRAHEALAEYDRALEFYERVLGCDINFRDVAERVEALR